MNFDNILEKCRGYSISERDKGFRFESLMKDYIQNYSNYKNDIEEVWLWSEFPYKKHSEKDLGIDLVASTKDGEYYALQCKCFAENTSIDKSAVDTFITASGQTFNKGNQKNIRFALRIWISTTNNWSQNAREMIMDQNPPVNIISLANLRDANLDWEKLYYGVKNPGLSIHQLRAHQQEALDQTHEYFKTKDRGKLIMACGTGKTFTSLRIAEHETKGKGLILFLAPSIALIGQTLREWTMHAQKNINTICICSDPQVGINKKKKNDDDKVSSFGLEDLGFPASTDVNSIIKRFKQIEARKDNSMMVVFSTYQSIDVIAQAMTKLKKKNPLYCEFDLIICDEAHRTTGITLSNKAESAFVKVHDNKFIASKKRIYMTATPRIYDANSKKIADDHDAVLCSMDDAKLYGEEIYHIGFGKAVDQGLLSDYKVLILTLNENKVSDEMQQEIKNDDGTITASDIFKLKGCVHALSKHIVGDDGATVNEDSNFMKRVVAFCGRIKDSQIIAKTFNSTIKKYTDGVLAQNEKNRIVSVSCKHIDGSMRANDRDDKIEWLKKETPGNECRILSNVRCLSEGVDVPSLDAILFISAKDSMVDIVQSVGRVMRKADGKKYGYIIIPVIVPSYDNATQVMDDNKTYSTVWKVLKALRSHDERLNHDINKMAYMELLEKKVGPIAVVGMREYSNYDSSNEDDSDLDAKDLEKRFGQSFLNLDFDDFQSVIYAKMVRVCGMKGYWEEWAKSVGEIAERQIIRITDAIETNEVHKKSFESFLGGLRKNINQSISQADAIEMLSQHIITKPVFEALFDKYSFVKENPISISMQSMLDLINEEVNSADTKILESFYKDVKSRVRGITTAEGKQKIIVELYDKFFKTAFPKMVERLGIVYTPVEIVDFIIQSVNDISIREFGRGLGGENVQILDPFTGTGTFMTRLIQSGIIEKENLRRKYTTEMHANEIVLLAYYIAAVNIENAYHYAIDDTETYTPFDGICLTDTFQLGEDDNTDKLYNVFPENTERINKQKKAPVKIILGNPPYSVGQNSYNDNNQNLEYTKLDYAISNTYVKKSNSPRQRSLYDSYIRAFRWATDRLGDNDGIICFISNGGWLDANSADGFRKSIENEFSKIYVFNLRGFIRGVSGDLAKREGQNVFDIMTGVAITLLVKRGSSFADNCKAIIYYKDIGDYLKREEKFKIITDYRSFDNPKMFLEILKPNEEGDWIKQRSGDFESLTPLAPKKKFDSEAESFFTVYSGGIVTSRDAWVYNFSSKQLENNITKMVEFYNKQRIAFHNEKNKNITPREYINYDSTSISWSDIFLNSLEKNIEYKFYKNKITQALYRPFTKQIFFYEKQFIHSDYQQSKLFPTPQHKNLLICVTSPRANKEFSVIMTDKISDNDPNGGTQCFPLYWYEEQVRLQGDLLEGGLDRFVRHDGVSDFILGEARRLYGETPPEEPPTKSSQDTPTKPPPQGEASESDSCSPPLRGGAIPLRVLPRVEGGVFSESETAPQPPPEEGESESDTPTKPPPQGEASESDSYSPPLWGGAIPFRVLPRVGGGVSLESDTPTKPPPQGEASESDSYSPHLWGVTAGNYITANPKTYKLILEMRDVLKKNPTEAEVVIWEYLRNKKTGFKIRRQQIIDDFIADFVCLSQQTVIEIDGKVHDKQKEYDALRTMRLAEFGFEVIRFSNEDVLNNPERVFQNIKFHLENKSETASKSCLQGEASESDTPTKPPPQGEASESESYSPPSWGGAIPQRVLPRVEGGVFSESDTPTKPPPQGEASESEFCSLPIKGVKREVSKEDLFYYVYGVLHSEDYRASFANDLKKMLPKLPLVDNPEIFWAFVQAGRKLAELHIGYEAVAPYDGVVVNGLNKKNYAVAKMRFIDKNLKDKIIFNNDITIENIPASVYDYVVNGKSAVEWVMERYQIGSHKESGIENNPNDWSAECGNERYILDLLLSVINVSLQTVEIVANLPKLF